MTGLSTYSNMTPIFVYGTLKKGRNNHDFLAGSRLIDKALTVQAYGFYTGPDAHSPEGPCIPYLYEYTDEGDLPVQVSGEVWKVDTTTLSNLDRLEGHPHWYQRVQAPVKLDSGKKVLAQIYLMPGQPDPGLDIITSGYF